MTIMSRIKEHMEVIGADGVHVGTVDRVEENRTKFTKADSGEGRHKGHHHYIDGSLVADVEGNKVRLSANGDVGDDGAGGLRLSRCGRLALPPAIIEWRTDSKQLLVAKNRHR